MDHSKSGIRHLAFLCKQKGIDTIVISPGSRNAPIIIAFQEVGLQCLSIVDERSAAFFALGIAQKTAKTVAIACTSGSAVLNYAPAISEAYYQRIPLLVLTADRPNEWIDQEDSQTIKQKEVYKNYVKNSYEIPQNISSEDDLWFTDRLINEAIDCCQMGPQGPVHINLPFKEPLYDGFDESISSPKLIHSTQEANKVSEELIKSLAEKWNASKKKLIVCGMIKPSKQLNDFLSAIAQDPSVVILTETTANISDEAFLPSIDRVLGAIPSDKFNEYTPELLITVGNQVISKRIKAFLRTNRPEDHWHVSADDLYLDTFQSLSHNITIQPSQFFSQLIEHIEVPGSDYALLWKSTDTLTLAKHAEFMQQCDFSDLTVMHDVLQRIPEGSDLQMGNSTVVRYIQLFPNRNDLRYYGNRGTSGIDGSISTAVGASFASQEACTLILGDLSFFYDSNGLWNNYLSKNLKIIIINNGGGGIFRFIDGPTSSNSLDFFETPHNLNAEHIAKTFNVNYLKATNEIELNKKLSELYSENQGVCILEIFTPKELNAEILKSYFKYLGE